jgi:opacity protein-like surface antigen
MRKWIGMLAASLLAAWAACGSAVAASDPLGFYVGAGVGTGNSSLNFTQSYKFAWDAFAGIRPVRYLGAELQYMDFGNPTPDQLFHYGEHTHAISAFGVGYLPLPWVGRQVDLFGKLGLAQLWGPHSVSIATPGEPFRTLFNTASETDFAFGAGAQIHFGAFAVRAEYEQLDATFGNPTLFTVEATWAP